MQYPPSSWTFFYFAFEYSIETPMGRRVVAAGGRGRHPGAGDKDLLGLAFDRRGASSSANQILLRPRRECIRFEEKKKKKSVERGAASDRAGESSFAREAR